MLITRIALTLAAAPIIAAVGMHAHAIDTAAAHPNRVIPPHAPLTRTYSVWCITASSPSDPDYDRCVESEDAYEDCLLGELNTPAWGTTIMPDPDTARANCASVAKSLGDDPASVHLIRSSVTFTYNGR